MENGPLLSVQHLCVDYGTIRAVDEVSFEISAADSVGLIGESGSGKSTILKAVAGILAETARTRGEILYEGRSLLSMDRKRRTALMGGEITMIFQNPEAFLDPVQKIGAQMEEVLLLHGAVSRGQARGTAKELLRLLALVEPERVLESYPFELSGGMCQRVCIAMAMSGERLKLLLADEPTSALDQALRETTADMLRDVKERTGAALLLVTHDIRLVRQISDTVGVMYRGHLVEWGKTEEILETPAHPYTESLIRAIPTDRSDFRNYTRYLEKQPPAGEHLWITPTHWVLR